jgi:DNA-binding response OmpR family regulator
MPKTILVVDDEEAVRGLLQEFLQISGFEVLLAAHGADAVGILRANRDAVDLILLDGTPHQSRRDTLVQVQALRPGIPVVVMSGKSWEDLKPQFEGLPVAGYLSKPSSLGALLELVEDLTLRSPGRAVPAKASIALP